MEQIPSSLNSLKEFRNQQPKKERNANRQVNIQQFVSSRMAVNVSCGTNSHPSLTATTLHHALSGIGLIKSHRKLKQNIRRLQLLMLSNVQTNYIFFLSSFRCLANLSETLTVCCEVNACQQTTTADVSCLGNLWFESRQIKIEAIIKVINNHNETITHTQNYNER